MGYRDEQVAVRARVEHLESELASARRELAESRAGGDRPARANGLALGGATFLGIALLLLVGAYIAGRMLPAAGALFGLLGMTLLCVAMILFVLSKLLVVVSPHELAVVSGRQHRGPDGSVIGYRLVRSGRFIRLPIIERVDFMDLTNHTIEIVLEGVYAKGGTRVTLEAVANVKVAGNEPLANRAVERFLGKERTEIAMVARETLEGGLRGIIAKLTPADLRRDTLRIAQVTIEEIDPDLSRLGLVLDTLKIQRVVDQADR